VALTKPKPCSFKSNPKRKKDLLIPISFQTIGSPIDLQAIPEEDDRIKPHSNILLDIEECISKSEKSEESPQLDMAETHEISKDMRQSVQQNNEILLTLSQNMSMVHSDI
jgi:hypothetical protein